MSADSESAGIYRVRLVFNYNRPVAHWPRAMSSVDDQRADELANSVYWRYRGAFHAKPVADAATLEQDLDAAAASIAAADGLLFVTGAGMGVDMGLQDFRSSNAFWEQLAHPQISRYEDSSDNKWFEQDPALAWGINYSQLNAYRQAEIHSGYSAMLELANIKGQDNCFCWTSNIDGVLQRAGFPADRVHECHGNIHRLQCTKGRNCKDAASQVMDAWEESVHLEVDPSTCRAEQQLPECIHCGALARPNVWFCTDNAYVPYRASLAVSSRYCEWVKQFEGSLSKNLVVIECGAGLVIASCRVEAEDRATDSCGVLVRINPSDSWVPPPPPASELSGADREVWCEDAGAEVGMALHPSSSRSGPDVSVPAKSIGIPLGSSDGMTEVLERVRRLVS